LLVSFLLHLWEEQQTISVNLFEMHSLLPFLFVVAVFVSVGAQQLPIPKTSLGVSRGHPDAPIKLEEFGDFQCPDCKEALPVVEQVLEYYGPEKIYYTWHTYPLWFHHQAWTAAKAAAIVKKHSPTLYWNYHRFVFQNQETFFNGAWYNRTENDLEHLFAVYVTKFGVAENVYWAEIVNDSNDVFNYANDEFHLGIYRGVYMTPQFLVNGFKAEHIDESTTFAQWKQFIDSLLK
jgi:protein-disulfide isomerase